MGDFFLFTFFVGFNLIDSLKLSPASLSIEVTLCMLGSFYRAEGADEFAVLGVIFDYPSTS